MDLTLEQFQKYIALPGWVQGEPSVLSDEYNSKARQMWQSQALQAGHLVLTDRAELMLVGHVNEQGGETDDMGSVVVLAYLKLIDFRSTEDRVLEILRETSSTLDAELSEKRKRKN